MEGATKSGLLCSEKILRQTDQLQQYRSESLASSTQSASV